MVWLARPALILAVIPLAGVLNPSWIWVASLAVVGMPHGAYDLAAVHRATGRRLGPTAVIFGIYTAIMLACVFAFVAAPTITLVAFLVLTAHHFGISDSVATRGGQRHTWFSHMAAFARGLAVIAAPFAFQPNAAWAPFAAMGGLVGGLVGGPVGGPAALDVGLVSTIAAGVTAFGLSVVALQALLLASRSRAAHAAEELVIPSLVVLVSMVAPPLMVIGMYFVAVHASGHCLRAVDPKSQSGEPSFRRAIGTHHASILLLVPSVVIVLALAIMGFGGVDADALAYAFILFCVCATLPHHLLWLRGIGSRLLKR